MLEMHFYGQPKWQVDFMQAWGKHSKSCYGKEHHKLGAEAHTKEFGLW